MQTTQAPNMRRAAAAEYLRQRHGIPISKSWLDKSAGRGGGPPITYFRAIPLYSVENLDKWAAEQLALTVHSTAGRRLAARSREDLPAA